jgi:hypothetical protein
VNSPAAVYEIEPQCLALVRRFGKRDYKKLLVSYLLARPGLAEKYARVREMNLVPVQIAPGHQVTLSPGPHSELIRQIWEEFGPRFVPGGRLVYVGDTGNKWGYFDHELLSAKGVSVDNHGKMPDVVIYYPEKDWLVLGEAVTSHGPVDPKRHDELLRLFSGSSAGLVFLSAFPDRRTQDTPKRSLGRPRCGSPRAQAT